MTALIESHTQNKELRTLGQRISKSQSDEMRFMKRWLEARNQPISEATSHASHGHAMDGIDRSDNQAAGQQTSSEHMPMQGMLTPRQLDTLRTARGKEFDRLFLSGMIQHHNGALVMVKDLFNTSGAGEDAELFNFASDVDSGQRAEIRVMQNMLGEKP
jgi:uncharacterized protein (DUF305 family)